MVVEGVMKVMKEVVLEMVEIEVMRWVKWLFLVEVE